MKISSSRHPRVVMKTAHRGLLFVVMLMLTSLCDAQISRQECMDQGGEVVGDIGNGAIFEADYLCENTAAPPTDIVVAQEGEPIATDGEVCCGGTGDGIDGATTSDTNDTNVVAADRDEMTDEECTSQNGIVVGDIGDGSTGRDDYICESNGLPPIANIVPADETSPIAIEGAVCCGAPTDVPETDASSRPELSRQECESQGGEIVGDIGDGSTRRSDYLCVTDGTAPIGNIVPLDGEPIAREGEVCCGSTADGSNDSVTTTADDGNEPSANGIETSAAVNISARSVGLVFLAAIVVPHLIR